MNKDLAAALGLIAFIVVILLLLTSSTSIQKKSTNNLQRGGTLKPLCEGEDCCSMANKDNYTCYCSVKCGPRAIGAEPNDNPQFSYLVDANGNAITQYGKKCFCQQTEKRNDAKMFIKNCI